MRWKPLDTGTPPKLLEWFFIGVSVPIWGPLIAGLWLHDQYRRFVPRPSDQWHAWFAWRPVRAWSSGDDRAVWLEIIERRRFFGSMDYRLPEAADHRRTA